MSITEIINNLNIKNCLIKGNTLIFNLIDNPHLIGSSPEEKVIKNKFKTGFMKEYIEDGFCYYGKFKSTRFQIPMKLLVDNYITEVKVDKNGKVIAVI